MKHDISLSGVCPVRLEFELDNNIVRNVKFTGGCNGNLKALSALVDGMSVDRSPPNCVVILYFPSERVPAPPYPFIIWHGLHLRHFSEPSFIGHCLFSSGAPLSIISTEAFTSSLVSSYDMNTPLAPAPTIIMSYFFICTSFLQKNGTVPRNCTFIIRRIYISSTASFSNSATTLLNSSSSSISISS